MNNFGKNVRVRMKKQVESWAPYDQRMKARIGKERRYGLRFE